MNILVEDEKLTLGILKRDKIRTVLWVIFPQGIEKENKKYVLSSNMLPARTLEKAWKLLLKYNGAYIERLYETKHYNRRVISIISRKEDDKLDEDALLDKYSKFPKVKIGE